MRAFLLSLGLATLLASCGYAEMREAEKQEEKMRSYVPEPKYCYQSIGFVECFATPYHRDERRIVSYFGPPPGNYPKPAPVPPAPHAPPRMIEYWVMDPEPVPMPAQPMQPAPPAQRKPRVSLVPLK